MRRGERESTIKEGGSEECKTEDVSRKMVGQQLSRSACALDRGLISGAKLNLMLVRRSTVHTTSSTMFIKRDLRKIPEILADPDDTCENLQLGRR